jgi:hypothetical protein
MKSLLLVMVIVVMSACGFDSDDPWNYEENTNIFVDNSSPTKIKKEYIGVCSFPVFAYVTIDKDYDHYKDELHMFSAQWADREIGIYNKWDRLWVNLPCRLCDDTHVNTEVSGKISVLDNMLNLVPWGCGTIRPPLQITHLEAKYGKQKYVFPPVFESKKEVCGGEQVLFDLNEACALFDVIGKPWVTDKPPE